ncbi:MAG TPA: hypothetical protein VGJ04_08845 [Pirellulales bacterium]|jgi:hypothetical protein
MASVSQRRTRRQGSYAPAPARAYSPPKRRWPKRLVLGLTFLVILVLLLPMIIAKTPLRDAPLRLALRSMHGTVQAGGASLSWFAPLEYTDIEIRNDRGELLVSLAKVQSERSLYGLLSNLNDLGTFRIERPQISVALRPDGSNLEDLFAKEKNPFAKSLPPQPQQANDSLHLPVLTAEIIDGTINLVDTASGQKWLIDKFNLHVRTAPDSALPVEVMVSAEVPVDGRAAQVAVSSAPAPGGGWDHIDAKIDALPLAMFRGFADRVAPGLQLNGTLSTNLRVDGIGANQPSQSTPGQNPISQIASGPIQISGSIELDNVAATGGPLGSDRLTLARVDMPCKVAFQNHQINIDQIGLNSEIGQLSVKGAVALSEQQPAQATAASLPPSTLNVDAQLDLAKLAAQLPSTLHVRSGTQITSGQLRLSLAAKSDAAGQAWNGQFTASDLAANYNGRRLTWDQPISVQLAARDQAGNYSIDAFNCTSSFLSISGHGSLDQFQAEGQFDLDRMMTELSQFVDLGSVKLGGRGDGRIHWSHGLSGEFQTGADVRLQALQIALPGKPAWQEDSVAVSATASGLIDNLTFATLSAANIRRLDSAQFTATVDNQAANTHEEVVAKLLQAEDKLATGNRWPLEIQAQGQLGRWWPRIASWLGIQDLDFSGACSLTAQAAYSAQGLEIQQAKATCNNLHAWGCSTVFIDEPVVQLESVGNYDFAHNQLSLNHTALLSSTASLQTDAATLSIPPGGAVTIQGNLAYQADLTRLSRWFSDPRITPKYTLAGRLIGSVDVARTGAIINGKLDAGVDNFAVYVLAESDSKPRNGLRNTAAAPQLVWQENRLTLAATAGLDRAADTMQLDSLDVGSQALTLHAAGKINDVSAQQNIDLKGKINYDWASLSALLKPYLGNRVEISGRQSRDFAVHGPLNSKDKVESLAGGSTDQFACLRSLTADAAVGWTQAQLYGLQTGNLDVTTHLENGTATFKPIETILTAQRSSGQLSITPVIHLSHGPPELVLGKGTILSNVQISDELSDSWLKFVAPMVTDSTRTEGSFSVELDGARVPLADPKKADVGGRLIVQNMTVTPGPLFRTFVVIGQQVEALVQGRIPSAGLNGDTALLKIDDQKVDFHLVDGRVYHQGLSMQVGQVTMRTRGWVGLDESVNIVVEIPVKDEWTRQRNSPLASLDESTIRIPIVGNLKDPKFDTRIMAKLLAAIPRAAIESGLNKTLDRLLPQR